MKDMKGGASQQSSCPYAAALSDEEDTGSAAHVEDLLEVAKTSCPAFGDGSCPFREAKNADDVRHALLHVPPSHLEQKGHFYRALRHLHHVSQTMQNDNDDDNKFALTGGCPVQTYSSPNASFVTAMEEWSLASIMAKMAQDLMDEEDEEETTQDDSPSNQEATSDTTSTTTTTSTLPTTQMQSSQQVTLSQALKTGTAASHQAAEDVHFVRNFIRGKIDRTLYGELVLSLYHVYAALEEALDTHAPQHFETCHFPHELSRKETLEDDVDFWHAAASANKPPSPATRDYVHRIQSIAQTEPLLLLAHAYTRYLGDLSGGKILARVARKAMQLQQDGLRFYEFDNVTSAKLFKDQYRSALDDLRLSPTQISKLVAEANVAFVLNMRLFEELDVQANIPGASVRDLQEALDFCATSTTTPESAECPFAKMASGSVQPTTKSRCPWPFVFMHDPVMGLKDYQTWIVLGLCVGWAWSYFQQTSHD